jgi:hypothetical protein
MSTDGGEKLVLPPLRAYVYVDGLNLYYGSLQGTPYRWLDLSALCARVFPQFTIEKIWYFTADVPPLPADPAATYRQRQYIRALTTLPNVEVKKGFFRLRQKDQQRVVPEYAPNPHMPNPSSKWVRVWRKEEKGSDVNLATALLIDAAAKGRFEHAWVISNDSDLAWPIERVQTEYGLPIGVLRPARPAGFPSAEPRHDSPELKKAVPKGMFRKINEEQLAACQFPAGLKDAYGVIQKPPEWDSAAGVGDPELGS